MPSLDLTPAQTTQELQNTIDFCTANIAKYHRNDKYDNALEKVKFYETYLWAAKSELAVAKLLANLKEKLYG
jgi:hypothetical protein